MVDIHNLRSFNKMLLGNAAYPNRAVSENGDPLCPIQSSAHGLPINPLPTLFGGFNRSNVGRGILVANGISFLVDRRLGENSAQFCLPRLGYPRLIFTLA